MADIYVQLGLLGRRVEEIDVKMAELVAERNSLEHQMKGLAAKIVTAAPSSSPAVVKPSAAAFFSQKAASTQEGLPPRYVRLLVRLSKSPGADVGKLAAQIYGNDEKSSRINVSSDFSRLKADGYVDAVRRGVFSLTEKGKAIVAGGARQND